MERQGRDPILELISRWRGAEWLIAGSWLTMLLALFLEWTTTSCAGATLCSVESLSGAGFSGWAWLTFLGFLAVILLLVVRPLLAPLLAGLVRPPQPRVPEATLYLGAGALELLGCVLFRIEFPGFSLGPTSITAGSGWYLAILAAAATVAGGELMRRRPRPVAPVPERVALVSLPPLPRPVGNTSAALADRIRAAPVTRRRSRAGVRDQLRSRGSAPGGGTPYR